MLHGGIPRIMQYENDHYATMHKCHIYDCSLGNGILTIGGAVTRSAPGGCPCRICTFSFTVAGKIGTTGLVILGVKLGEMFNGEIFIGLKIDDSEDCDRPVGWGAVLGV